MQGPRRVKVDSGERQDICDFHPLHVEKNIQVILVKWKAARVLVSCLAVFMFQVWLQAIVSSFSELLITSKIQYIPSWKITKLTIEP